MTLLESVYSSSTTSFVIIGSEGKCLVACSGVIHERSIDELIGMAPNLSPFTGSFKN